MNVAQVVANSLERLGVSRVYGLVGTSVLEFVDALSYTRVRYISTRHEQVAASMADAEGRSTRRPGIAMVHGGPGFLNSLIGIANAYKDSSPMVLIAGAVKRRMSGLDGWLEVPQLEMTKKITKLSLRLDRPQEAAGVVARAYWTAASHPQGPCYIEVPEDVWSAGSSPGQSLDYPQSVPVVPEESLAKVGAMLAKSNRPLLLVGGGINSKEGSEAVRSFATSRNIRVVSTGNGRGVMPEDHPLCLGRVGFGGGNIVADFALVNADLLLAVGCGVSDVTTYGYNLHPSGETVVVDFATGGPMRYSLHLTGDGTDFLRRLNAIVPPTPAADGWGQDLEEKAKEWRAALDAALSSSSRTETVNPSRFFQVLGEHLPPHSTVTGGQGLHILYAHAFLKAREHASFLEATNLGAMGFAFPASLGAKLAMPDREVVAVLGDGEFMMTLQDMETAVRENIPVKVVVVNDNSYRVLLMRQMVQKMGRVVGTKHSNPKMGSLGAAFGFESRTVSADSDIEEAVNFLLAGTETPVVVELIVSPEDLPPLNLEASLKF